VEHKISIVTVVRNGANTIVRAMDSVLSQTYPDIEYIVIDGASTDGTVDLIRQYQDRLTFWSSEPDSGISDAFNKGVRRATGEWVGILNADDWYEPDAVEQVMRVSHDADIVHGAMRYWDGDAVCEVALPNQEGLSREMTINHPTVFVRRSFYERFGEFKEDYRFAMDYELLIRFLMSGARFVQLDEILTNMSFGGASDKYWKAASEEVRRAQTENGMSASTAALMHYLRLVRGSGRRFLQVIGLGKVVAAYRRRFALMRKEHPC
jgi:glycosyltransferase involved in cell wall biosynthesis